MDFNPVHLARFNRSQTLQRTKTDVIECAAIARWLMKVEYKYYPIGFYHTYSFKSLTRLRDSLVRQQSFYLVKITNVLGYTSPEFKPFFGNRFSRTALYLLENYGSSGEMSLMDSQSYENLRRLSHGKFSPQKFLELKALAGTTVGKTNEMFDAHLSSLLSLYNLSVKAINLLAQQIIDISDQSAFAFHPRIGLLSAAVIYAKFGNISRFSSPQKMLSFAWLESGYYQTGTSAYRGCMVKRGSSFLRYTLINLCIPLMNYNIFFEEYFAKKRSEGKPHRVACSHIIKKLIRVLYKPEKYDIVFDSEKLR